ncbi:P-loop containing nucleoside triphosphate hydrolase protein [Ascobolus immersus RN42]|uniref:Adenylate kinase isoenzyme 6 homolog n=1 Tax=Ascobolus immersus RN42 TaxID=1160509 RepID=A0A3N4ICM0_ASCIM|nr:P-loop containing nucleoside triphosphate hydrolase protein [Ascobolus immersus RN42]
MARTLPNIILTGTPGVGKSTHAAELAEATGLSLLDVNDVIKNKECHDGFDDELQSWIVDEDKLMDEIEDDIKQGGKIIDWHVCDIFPERLIDLVVVLRTDNAVLYDRLKARNYNDKKIENNMDAEIMQVILDEARESYNENIVIELASNTVEDMESNVERISQWVQNWVKDNKDRGDDDDE